MKHFLTVILTTILWAGCIVNGQSLAEEGSKSMNARATLSFTSFDGGGPEFSLELGSDIAAFVREKKYGKPDHDEMEGAGYTITYIFKGLKEGETTMTVREWSPIAGNEDHLYALKVDEELNVTIKSLKAQAGVSSPIPTLVIACNGKMLYASLDDNGSAKAFAEKLSAGVIEVHMHDYGSFEKVGTLPWSLDRNDATITTAPGDVILYNGNQITIYYDRNNWNLTRLGRIGNVKKEDLLEFFGDGNATVKFWVEWSE